MITVKEILNEINQNNYICPMPVKWNRLWKMLPNRKRNVSAEWEPPLPLILSAWSSSPEEKLLRFEEHLEWAYNHQVLDKVYNYLNSLNKNDWLKNNEKLIVQEFGYNTEEHNCHQMEGYIELCLPYKCEDTYSELIDGVYVIYVEDRCIALIENFEIISFDEDSYSERTTQVQDIIKREYS